MSEANLYRVIMPAGDIEVSSAFYARLFDQPGMKVSGGRHYFRCGGVVLAVYSPAGDGDRTTPHANFGHVYISVDDLEAVFGRAQALGCLVTATGDGGLPMGEIAKRPWGERSFYADDPFGNPLCFVDAATLFTGRPPE
jgi:catechol 2,3-dioxygenase-like lactoylglutathione lyase family enzyme